VLPVPLPIPATPIPTAPLSYFIPPVPAPRVAEMVASISESSVTTEGFAILYRD
jgi:hypothetical protein